MIKWFQKTVSAITSVCYRAVCCIKGLLWVFNRDSAGSWGICLLLRGVPYGEVRLCWRSFHFGRNKCGTIILRGFRIYLVYGNCLSLNSLGNSWSNSYISLIITLRFTCSERNICSTLPQKTANYYEHDCRWCLYLYFGYHFYLFAVSKFWLAMPMSNIYGLKPNLFRQKQEAAVGQFKLFQIFSRNKLLSETYE